MVALVLQKLWLTRLDTGASISGASGRDRATGYAMDGDVRTYASGRRRAVSTVGVKTEVTRTMVALDYTTKELLITWLGVNVQMRDHRGNKWFGVFYAVGVDEYMRSDLYSATITLLTTTTVEGV
jgi:hypothetical protein